MRYFENLTGKQFCITINLWRRNSKFRWKIFCPVRADNSRVVACLPSECCRDACPSLKQHIFCNEKCILRVKQRDQERSLIPTIGFIMGTSPSTIRSALLYFRILYFIFLKCTKWPVLAFQIWRKEVLFRTNKTTWVYIKY